MYRTHPFACLLLPMIDYAWFTKVMTASGDLVLVMASLCCTVEMVLCSDVLFGIELVNKETKFTSEHRMI